MRINDPASTKDARLNGDLATFKSQVKYYWAIDARAYNTEVEKTVTKDEAKKIIKKKAGLSDSTIAFLDAYRYGDDLLIKLATAMQ